MTNFNKAKLFVLSGASGSGKTTLCRYLEETYGFVFSVSTTTRPPRSGEKEGEDYHFISLEDFKQKIKEGDFLEWAEVHGNYYGTTKSTVESALYQNKSVLLDIDTQGAFQVKKTMPEAVLIFLSPSKFETLRARLRRRATDSPEAIEKRLQRAAQEIKEAKNYDYQVINDDLKIAKQSLNTIVEKELG